MLFARAAPSASRASRACFRPAGAALPGLAPGWRAGSSAQHPPREGIPWSTFGFSQSTKDTTMIVATCQNGERWDTYDAMPYGPISLEPSATILNYGQGIFEGIKAYRTEKGRIVIFRPKNNGQRCADGARRMLMPSVPVQLFVDAVSACVRENAHWVPPTGEGALYLRPIVFGSGADLGVKPSSEFKFIIYCTPVGQYFGPGTTGARMKFCVDHHRAAMKGIGHVKAGGNYAPCFRAQLNAKSDGFSDVIYLDPEAEYIEEAAASNFFCIDEHGVVHTPGLGTILPGVTRDSVIQLILDPASGLQLKVGKVSVQTALNAKEAFVCGTGAGITPIEHMSGDAGSADFQVPGPMTKTLQKALTDIQLERVEDKRGWLIDPFEGSQPAMQSYADPSS